MPTEGGFSCLFSILKWATNDRPYIVNRRPMITPTSLMGGSMIAPTSFAATPHYWNGSFFGESSVFL